MFKNAEELPGGAALEADVCVVGAGAAGITIALEFIGTNRRVLILEGGQERYSSSSQELYDGENVGLPYDVGDTRARFFGGSTNCWGGWCRPLDPIDFETRDWVPNSGWPISHAELDPYYSRAYEHCGLPGGLEHPATQGPEPLAPGSDQVETWTYRKSPVRRFGNAYRDQIAASQNIEVLLNANVTELVSSDDGATVVAAKIATNSGRRLTVKAVAFVLAAGGIENPRLLLLSRAAQPAGIGNGHDQVGRYFMEHPQLSAGDLIYNGGPQSRLDRYDSEQGFLRAPSLGTLAISRDAQRKDGLLGCTADIFAEYKGMRSDGYQALRRTVLAARRGAWSEVGRHTKDVSLDMGNVVMALVCRRFRPSALLVRRAVILICEPNPDPESRVTLSHEHDRLGLNQVRLDWKMDEPLVLKTLRRAIDIMAQELQSSGAGDVRGRLAEEHILSNGLGWCWHHMGTTRMAASPRHGVVDRDCRVFGTNNLFVAGSSVFTTGGTDTPTLTIVALATRLSDHLKTVLAPGLAYAAAWNAAGQGLAETDSRVAAGSTLSGRMG